MATWEEFMVDGNKGAPLSSVDTLALRSAKRKLLAEAIFKMIIGFFYGIFIAVLSPLLLPYFFARDCYREVEWPWYLGRGPK